MISRHITLLLGTSSRRSKERILAISCCIRIITSLIVSKLLLLLVNQSLHSIVIIRITVRITVLNTLTIVVIVVMLLYLRLIVWITRWRSSLSSSVRPTSHRSIIVIVTNIIVTMTNGIVVIDVYLDLVLTCCRFAATSNFFRLKTTLMRWMCWWRMVACTRMQFYLGP